MYLEIRSRERASVAPEVRRIVSINSSMKVLTSRPPLTRRDLKVLPVEWKLNLNVTDRSSNSERRSPSRASRSSAYAGFIHRPPQVLHSLSTGSRDTRAFAFRNERIGLLRSINCEAGLIPARSKKSTGLLGDRRFKGPKIC